ncbi:receiver/sensor box histidine kinase [Azospirillum picis]|uniref:histidine kinase n=1 Tax=Azospirillum picis TaxID=488438 RepID=A0ABU0MIL9_9PROT|nr:HAMP domain-containing sensor histidine kinase [Azospirillum picis]MBP2299214.1 PAS domain S-box-containing protein [Azospirillum picis]MDQ0533148.1 PAS domain S-box-containing protein [Azospirillum picis]
MVDVRGANLSRTTVSRTTKAKPLVVQPIWDELDQAVIVTDRNLETPGPSILYVNHAFTRLTGYRPDEVIGKTPSLLQSPRTNSTVAAALLRDLVDGGSSRGTLLNRRKDGSEYFCALRITPLLGPTGLIEHYICVAEPLKEDQPHPDPVRLTAELEQALTLVEDLEQRRTEANALIERQRREIDQLNERNQATNRQLDEVLERLTLRENALDRRGQASLRSEEELHAPLEELRMMDEELRTSLEQVEEANAELARSNEELRRLRQADADKLRLLATASHDLRQPVMSMGLFLDVLRHRLGDDERPLMGGLLAAHVATRTLLDGMLDTARLDAGALDPTIEPVPMGLILDAIHGEFMPQAEMRGLRFRVVPCPATVLSDVQLLERILRNLVANALKYTDSGGILVCCRHRDESLRIEVWDSGPGIPAESQRAIFEEFQQLDNPQRDQRRGVGLGLAIVARLARQLGHEISLRSRAGHGSIFSVTVPLAPVAAPFGLRAKKKR